MCSLCSTPFEDSKQGLSKRLEDIAALLKSKAITQKHADKLIAEALDMDESVADPVADAQWERNRR